MLTRIERLVCQRWFLCLALALVTVAIYWPVRHFPFLNFDDNVYVTAEPHVLAGFTWEGIRWAFADFRATFWHPLTMLSLMLDREIWGDYAGGFHLTNVWLHCASTVIFFITFEGMTGARGRSAFVAGLFALHPLHVESVAWIAERKDVLSTFFWALTMWAYLCYVRCPGIWRYVAVIVSLALGLMAKPMLVTLPFVLLLLDYWPLGRFRLAQPSDFSWRLVWEKIPMLALVLIASVQTMLGHENEALQLYPLADRLRNALVSYVAYIGKMFWPADLSVLYPFRSAIPGWQLMGGAVLLVGVTVWVIIMVRRQGYLAVGWFLYVGTLLPVSGVVQVAAHGMADRYTYVPFLGLFIMLAWGGAQLLETWPQRREILLHSGVGVLALCAWTTSQQLPHWRSQAALFEQAMAAAPDSVVAMNNVAWMRATHPDPAVRNGEEALRLALKINELEKYTVPAFLDTLAAALAENGRFEEAVATTARAIDLAHLSKDEAMAADIRTRADIYHQRRAFRDVEGKY